MGGDSCSEGRGFESRHCILDLINPFAVLSNKHTIFQQINVKNSIQYLATGFERMTFSIMSLLL